MLRTVSGGLLAMVLTCSTVSAQEWAQKMFATANHDFGTVARGAKAEFEFEVTNLYLEDAHISEVHSSCGCTNPSIKNGTLKTHEKGAILAAFNTKAFEGQRGATITVTFDKPFFAQVQLNVKGFIRGDVLLTPGSAEMGTLDQGTPAEKTIAINYAGSSDWRIVNVKSSNSHLSGKIVETGRNYGQIAYNLVVRLDEKAPEGYLTDHLFLVTNDQRLQVPVPVSAMIQSKITVSPVSLFLGVVQPGQKVTKQVLVKSKKPFVITKVSCDGEGFQFDTSAEKTPKELHILPVTFIAGGEPGRVAKTIHIETDLGDTPSAVSASAVVTDPSVSTKTATE